MGRMQALMKVGVIVPEARLVTPDLRGEAIRESVQGLGPALGLSPRSKGRRRNGEHRPCPPPAFGVLDDQAKMAEFGVERR